MTYERALAVLSDRGITEPQVVLLSRQEGISRLRAARRLLAASV
jgi:hypothetical protein